MESWSVPDGFPTSFGDAVIRAAGSVKGLSELL